MTKAEEIDLFVHNVQHVVNDLCAKAKNDPDAYRKYGAVFSDIGHTAFEAACKIGPWDGSDANESA